MVESSKVNVKLSDTQLKKLKNAVKKKNRNNFENKKMFNGTTLPHEFATLTTRQKEKVRNALSNNMSNDLKLSKAEISKIIQSGGFVASLLR